jgi:hypothetical protein
LVIAAPPLLAGGVNAIDATPSPGVAEEIDGAPGAALGVTLTGEEAVPGPTLFTARKRIE